jgi:hypothetical protein
VRDLFLLPPLADLMPLAGQPVKEGVELRVNPARRGFLQGGARQGHKGMSVQYRLHLYKVIHEAHGRCDVVGCLSRQAKDQIYDRRQVLGGDDLGRAVHVGDRMIPAEGAQQTI